MSRADAALYAACNWMVSNKARLTAFLIVCATSPVWLPMVVGS